MDDKDAEIARLRAENEELRRKTTALERLAPLRPNPGSSHERVTGSTVVERDGLKYEVRAGEDPEEIHRSWLVIMGQAGAESGGPEPA